MGLFDDDLIENDKTEKWILADSVADFLLDNYYVAFVSKFRSTYLSNWDRGSKAKLMDIIINSPMGNGKFIFNWEGASVSLNREASSITNGLFEWGVVLNFSISNNNNIYSLKGSPKKTIENYYCGMNFYLKDLTGAPEIVGGDFDCRYCDIRSFNGAPKYIGKNLIALECHQLDNLIKLSDCEIGGDLSICQTTIQSLAGIDHLKVSKKIHATFATINYIPKHLIEKIKDMKDCNKLFGNIYKINGEYWM